MQQENQLKVVNKKGCHAELVSASSTHVVSQRQQQRRAWKTPNHYYRTPYYNLTGRGQAVRAAVWGDNSLFNNSNNGFTLIELLVVVLIIGILAAVAVPQYQKAVAKSRLANLKSLVTSISNAAEVYELANNTYPTTFDELAIDIPTPTRTEQNSNNFIAYYPWGSCTLQNTATQKFVNCVNYFAHIVYAKNATTSSSDAGRRTCAATDNNELAAKICQQDTGASAAYYTGIGDGITAFLYVE